MTTAASVAWDTPAVEPIAVLHWTDGEPAIQQIDPRALTRPARGLSEVEVAALLDMCGGIL